MANVSDFVFLFDVDNTLLDNDRIQADLSQHLASAHGIAMRDRYWAIFEQLRVEIGFADYLGALERYRLEALHDPRILRIANWLVDYPFANRLYSGWLDAVRAVRSWGPSVILSDGDAVFQPRKIERSGLWSEFEDKVLIYVHKEQELADVEHWHPARRYVLIDDKLRILTAVKRIWGDKVTTVFVKQGHYAQDAATLASLPPADLEIERIADLPQRLSPVLPPLG
jgi:FMN phosphatase YigB (HAD superfamily)